MLEESEGSWPWLNLNEVVMYGGGRLVEAVLLVMNLLMRSEASLADCKRSLLGLSIRMVTMRIYEIIGGLP